MRPGRGCLVMAKYLKEIWQILANLIEKTATKAHMWAP